MPKVPDQPTPDDRSLDDELQAVVAEEHCRHDRQMISDFAGLTMHVMWGDGMRDTEALGVLEAAVSTPHDLIEIIGALCREIVRLGADTTEHAEGIATLESVNKATGAITGGLLGIELVDSGDLDEVDAKVVAVLHARASELRAAAFG